MRKIGFDWGWGGWGKSSKKKSVSKWEKSYFGGFYRLVSDHPRVVVDINLDFTFATWKYLAYFEKEKICKIFLSKVKKNDLIADLMSDAVTTTETNNLGQNVLVTTLAKYSKNAVLNELMGIDKEKEYYPFFDHYKKFILETEFFFKKIDNSDDQNQKGENQQKNKNENEEEKQEDQKNQGGGDEKQDENDDSKQDEKDEQDENGEQNKNKQNKNQGQQDHDKEEQDKKDKESQIGSAENCESKQEELDRKRSEKEFQNFNEFLKALEDIKEEEYKYDFLSTYNKKPRTIILPDYSETQFTQSEKDVADNLTNMLDISFDPTEDTVKNLRLGKLDISKIAEVPAGNIAIYKQTVENQTTKPFSVVILCDESGSMGEKDRITSVTRLQKQHQTIKSLYLAFSDILPQEKIFIYGHSGHYTPELYVYHDPYNQNFVKTIDRMCSKHDESEGYNYDGPIIEEVHKNIRTITSDRIIFIILSDGLPNGDGYGYKIPSDIVNMKQVIEKCKRDDFVTVGIGIMEHRVKDLYQYGAVINDLSEMPKKVSHIVNHVVKTEFQ